MDIQCEMPRYQCHKVVHALKIREVEVGSEVPIGSFARLHFHENGYAPLVIDADFYYGRKPQVGGYYVVYEDGYQSFSPADAFESGYSLIK